jgi:hypothetical protein
MHEGIHNDAQSDVRRSINKFEPTDLVQFQLHKCATFVGQSYFQFTNMLLRNLSYRMKYTRNWFPT